MCGIIASLAEKNVIPFVLSGLRCLEYRGYDSAGIAAINNVNIEIYKEKGKLINLEKSFASKPIESNICIGHTRWATHGEPNKENAHPHYTDNVTIIHNGIIENYMELTQKLLDLGIKKNNQTDSEVIALLFDYYKRDNSPWDAFVKMVKDLKGAYAIVAMSKDDKDHLYCAKNGSPLCFGFGENKVFLSSDPIAIGQNARSFFFLEDGEIGKLSKNDFEIFDLENKKIEKKEVFIDPGQLLIDKGDFRHFMLKEIFEQPQTIIRSIPRNLISIEQQKSINIDSVTDLSEINNIDIIGCGTAFYAGIVASYWFKKYAKINCNPYIASEYRYTEQPSTNKGLAIIVSQSGETADSLACGKIIKDSHKFIFSVLNVKNSSIYRISDYNILTNAGTEVGVASTKAFTSQLMVLLSLAINIGVKNGNIDHDTEKMLINELTSISSKITTCLHDIKNIKNIANEISKAKSVFYIGRGVNYPIACEGALKLKEISYIHAEGYPAGELKHGPLALIDEKFPVVVIAPYDRWFEKTVSNMQEIMSRGGPTILVTDEIGEKKIGSFTDHKIIIPNSDDYFSPMISVIPMQLIAYYTALKKGTDVDKPRNLAKSVTVE